MCVLCVCVWFPSSNNPPSLYSNGADTTHETHTIEQTDEFTCGSGDGFFPSPRSCLEYFICASHISYSVRCGDGLVFNANTGFCDLPEHYTCTLGDAPATSTSAPAKTTAVHTNYQQPQHSTHPPVVHTDSPTTGGTLRYVCFWVLTNCGL